MNVEVIIPFSGNHISRYEALAWVKAHLNWPITVATLPYQFGPWSKAAAFNPAVKASRADVIVMCDCDVYCEELPLAIQEVSDGVSWAIPHRTVYRLSENASELFMEGEDYANLTLDRFPYEGYAGGGIVVAKREVFLDVPMDPLFVGWGQEDASFGAALWTLYGKPWRGEADLIHLYHPPEPRVTNRWGNEANRRRYQEVYLPAVDHPEEMRAIIEEMKSAAG